MIGYLRKVGRSRGRHAAPRSGFSRVVGFVAGGAGLLVLAGILVSVAVPWASSGSSPHPTPSAAAETSIFDLKGFAEGPAKAPSASPVVVPKTVLDPYAVADPYPDYQPTMCPEGTVAGSTDANGNQSNCQAPASGTGTPTTGG
jgi:hypothetical protein